MEARERERERERLPRGYRGDFYVSALNCISKCDNEKFYFQTFNASRAPLCDSLY